MNWTDPPPPIKKKKHGFWNYSTKYILAFSMKRFGYGFSVVDRMSLAWRNSQNIRMALEEFHDEMIFKYTIVPYVDI